MIVAVVLDKSAGTSAAIGSPGLNVRAKSGVFAGVNTVSDV